MKFQQFPSLQKHISSSFSLKQVPRSYLVAHPHREERRKYWEKIIEEVKKEHKDAVLCYFDGEKSSWADVHGALITPSLFGEQQIIVWDGIKKLPEIEEVSCVNLLKHFPSFAFFIIGIEDGKDFVDLYQKTKQEILFLDFSEEKPWDKQKRVQNEIGILARNEGKNLSPKALQHLCSLSAFDLVTAESELRKVITYVGDRKEITDKDVEIIGSNIAEATGWQLAEELVFANSFSLKPPEVDLPFLLSFFGQIRFYLQQAKLVGSCVEQGMSLQEVAKKLPQIKPTQMQKINTALMKFGLSYMENSLESLYKIELLAKNSNISPKFLWDFLCIKMISPKMNS